MSRDDIQDWHRHWRTRGRPCGDANRVPGACRMGPQFLETVDLSGSVGLRDRHDAAALGNGCRAVVAIAADCARRSLPSADGATSSFDPLEKNSGAPHSSVSTCAVAGTITLW